MAHGPWPLEKHHYEHVEASVIVDLLWLAIGIKPDGKRMFTLARVRLQLPFLRPMACQPDLRSC